MMWRPCRLPHRLPLHLDPGLAPCPPDQVPESANVLLKKLRKEREKEKFLRVNYNIIEFTKLLCAPRFE